MRSAAVTTSLLLHCLALYAAWSWRTTTVVVAGADVADSGPAISLLAEADSAPSEQIVVPVEFTPPQPATDVSVSETVSPVVTTVQDSIATTPAGIASGVPASAPKARARGGSGHSGGGGAYQPPRYRVCPPPPYPAVARAQRIEGAALLLVTVDASGRPVSVALRRSSGSAVLDAAAIRAVWQWRFEPARAEGRAVAASVEVPVRFRVRA